MTDQWSAMRPESPEWSATPEAELWRITHAPPVRDLGVLDQTLCYARLGLTLVPPPADVTPALDAVEASERFARSGGTSCGTTGPVMFLALATAEHPRHQSPEGVETRTINDTLTYVFRAEDVPCRFSEPAGAAGRGVIAIPTPQAPHRDDRCLVIGLMDAADGSWIVQVRTNSNGQ